MIDPRASQRGTSKRSLLKRLCREQKNRCCYCCVELSTTKSDSEEDHYASIEHIETVYSIKKKNPAAVVLDYGNCVAACSKCNRLRGNIDAYTFYEHKLWKPEYDKIRLDLIRCEFFKISGITNHLRKVNYCNDAECQNA